MRYVDPLRVVRYVNPLRVVRYVNPLRVVMYVNPLRVVRYVNPLRVVRYANPLRVVRDVNPHTKVISSYTIRYIVLWNYLILMLNVSTSKKVKSWTSGDYFLTNDITESGQR